MLAPVSHRVEMMRGVVSVIEAVTVALVNSQLPVLEAAKGGRGFQEVKEMVKSRTGTSSKVMLDR